MANSRILLTGSLVMILFTMLGTMPGLASLIWPIPLLWGVLAWSSCPDKSIIAALTLTGLFQDLSHEAPLGSWPLAGLIALAAGQFPLWKPEAMRLWQLFGTALTVTIMIVLIAGPDEKLLLDLAATILTYPLMSRFFTKRDRLSRLR